MTQKITKDGEYTTRDGRPVRIYAVDGGEDGAFVHGAFLLQGRWVFGSWRADGVYTPGIENHSLDLIPKPKVHKLDVWCNVYLGEDGTVSIGDGWDSRARAEARACNKNRIACIHIQRDITEGEGV